ncbi:MAG TPA: hypothetical protein VHD15_14665 [Hyphomicrobiales bacterium]|nr:hypothetical protein [Hyphomicrobiales bacterium]
MTLQITDILEILGLALMGLAGAYVGAREVRLLRQETGDKSWLTYLLSGDWLPHLGGVSLPHRWH